MPHATEGEPFNHISVKELHPTFGAEVHGVDFSKPVPDDTFAEISEAMAKVSTLSTTSTTTETRTNSTGFASFARLDSPTSLT